MSDNPQQDTTPDNSGTGRTFTQAELDSIIKERLDKERKKYADYDDVKAKARKYEEAEQASLSELEKAKKRIAELEALANEVETANQTMQQLLDRELESIPEDKRDLILGDTPREKLADITRLKSLGLFAPQQPMKPTPPNTDAGAGVKREGVNASALPTPDDIEWAKALGLSIEAYMKQKIAARAIPTEIEKDK